MKVINRYVAYEILPIASTLERPGTRTADPRFVIVYATSLAVVSLRANYAWIAHRQVEHPQGAVDNKSFVRKKLPFICWSFSARLAHGIIALVTVSQDMTHDRQLKSLSIANPSGKPALLKRHLTAEQLHCLSRCAKGISLRFERLEIVDALVAGGYAEEGVAGVVTVTAKGQQYLQTHAS